MVWQKQFVLYPSKVSMELWLYQALRHETLDKTPPSDWRHVAANIPILSIPRRNHHRIQNETYAGQILLKAPSFDANLLSYPFNPKFITEKVAILLCKTTMNHDVLFFIVPAMGPCFVNFADVS